LAYYGYFRPSDTMPSAIEAATRATVIDPESAEAHNALAVAALLWERDFAKAEREFREALRLNPRYTQARCWYGLFFLQWGVGRDQDGLAEAERAFENDPLSAYATTVLSLALATVKRRDEAVRQAQNAVQQDPESFLAKWELACAYHWNCQHEKAIAIFEPLWANSGHNWVTLGLVPAYMRAGGEDRARSLYESLVDRHAREYVQPFVLALSATAVGEHEAAIRFCEAAIEGATCCSRSSTDGGRTLSVSALIAVTTTSSFASIRANARAHNPEATGERASKGSNAQWWEQERAFRTDPAQSSDCGTAHCA
jgi:tetratricopeptide (TPR) repeat protein